MDGLLRQIGRVSRNHRGRGVSRWSSARRQLSSFLESDESPILDLSDSKRKDARVCFEVLHKCATELPSFSL